MVQLEISSRFPQFGKEFLFQRCAQVTNSFRAARAPFGANHSLDHLDVMRSPQREILVVLKKGFAKFELFITVFKVSEQFQHSPGTLAVASPAFFFAKILFIQWRLETAARQ